MAILVDWQIRERIINTNMVTSRSGVVVPVLKNISVASLDVTLGRELILENPNGSGMTIESTMGDQGYYMEPGEFLLANTDEIFHLPTDLTASYQLKSTLGRMGLEHALAGFCDPGWNGSTLTLELKSNLRYGVIHLVPGMKIGQIVFTKTDGEPDESYAKVGHYNGDIGTVGPRTEWL